MLLHWSAPIGVVPQSYDVLKQMDTDWSLLDRVVGTDYEDWIVAAGGLASYRVVALNSQGVAGQPSNPVSVQVPRETRPAGGGEAPAPSAPMGLRTLWAPGVVTVTWSPAAEAAHYDVERAWAAPWMQIFSRMGLHGTSVGGMIVYRTP